MAYKFYDKYSKKAQEEGYKARSAYKLLEIQKKHKILHAGDRVLDLGCAPGSWAQVTTKIIGPKGQLYGIDLKEVKVQFPNANFRVADVFKVTLADFDNQKMNVLLSDMAPNTSGIKSQDQARSFELCQKVLDMAPEFLLNNGYMVMKMFMSQDVEVISKQMKQNFKKALIIRPDSTRKTSTEVFLVGLAYRAKTLETSQE